MLEATLSDAIILKRLLDSIRELVTDANFECNEEGIRLQAMDNSHVALVAVQLRKEGFVKYRCDRPMPLGVNLGSLSKVVKAAKDNDLCILKAGPEADILCLTYESKTSDRVAEYDIKLMDIDVESLGIPDTQYDAKVTMPSAEFARIVRDLNQLGESVKIEVSKEGVRFAAEGEAANGSVLLKQTDYARRLYSGQNKAKTKARRMEAESGEDEEDDEATQVKKEADENDMDGVEEQPNGNLKLFHDVEGEDEVKEEEAYENESENEEGDTMEGSAKKRKKAQKAEKSSKKAKKEKHEEAESGGVYIEMSQHVALTFSLKYLVNFSKSTPLSDRVQLKMSNDVPLLVLYDFGPGTVQYYLAPKIGDE